jgi:hypothetical protein
MVHFRCKACGAEHPAPVPFAEKLYFDTAATLEINFECPEKGVTRRYNKTDLLWREVEAGEPAAIR